MREFNTRFEMFDFTSYINKVPPFLKTTLGVYLTWIILHYIATHLYSNYCNNLSIYGFIFSPLTNTTPFCRGLVYIINTGSNNISNMWSLIGTWAAGYIMIPK